MQLKSLEIQGFKSFADKTRLEFGSGLTAVVGPNGSGKSNISDAVRWVMGEQSTKVLRGSRMEDVIFGGTQNRKPQGFAQVSLTIRNDDHQLPVEAQEVTITRKLYRSGESEYRLNNVAVRLRDIHELFMDTGLGRDGYSMIGQGRIAEIVGAKSTQRREIFEEAAGISKFRYRKEEAEKRLGQAQENLLRLRDILAELEGRVEPLRQQSEKAERFLALSQRRKGLEISLWMNTVERVKQLLRENEDALTLQKGEYDELQQKLADLEAAAAQCYERMQRCLVEMDGNRSRMREYDEQAAQVQSRTAVLHNDVEHNQRTIGQLTQEMENAGQGRRQLEEQMEENRQAMGRQRAEAERLEREQGELAEKLAQLTGESGRQQERRQALQEQLTAVGDELSKARIQSAAAESLMSQTRERIQEIEEGDRQREENILRYQSEIAECRQLLENLQGEIEGLQNAAGGYRLKEQSRQERLKELTAKQQEHLSQASALEQRARLLEDMERNMEGFGSSVRFVMQRAAAGAIRGVHGPVSQLLSTDERYATAIEIALGAGMQNIVVENENVAKQAIGLLKSAREGRATFLPLSAIRGRTLEERGLADCDGFVGVAAELVSADPKYAQIVASLLGRIVVAEDLDYAVAIAKRYGYRFRIVTLDGQVVNAGGSMTGGYTAKSAGVLTRRHEIETLRQKAGEQRAEAQRLAGQIKSVGEELSALQASLTGLEGRMRTAREEVILQTAEQKRLELTLREAQAARDAARAQYQEMTRRLEQLRTDEGGSGQAIGRMVALAGELTAQLDALSEELRRQGAAAAEVSETLAKNRMDRFAAEKEMQLLEQTDAQLAAQEQERVQRRQGLADQIAALQAENQRIEEEIERLRVSREEWQAQSRQLAARNEALAAERSDCEQRQNQLRAEERQLTEQREQFSRELARLEERRTTLQGEYDGIIAKLWDEYELTLSQAAELAVPVEDDLAAQRELTSLRNQIRALGSINVAAIEEYREVSQRYTFMKEQIEDVEHAREELMRLIRELTGEMVQLFSENFKRINQHFGRIFVELFGGGRAELILENPDDVLESGIEIFVQPPGKIIKNLTALSGGEQAFVAIAIYFAILHVRPAPFCLLDDVNVVKFAKYLRRLTSRTQFIAITHRRGTMEEADVLYGVTMQEEGVSKMLELKVSEVEQKLGLKNR